jgi:hypothetical protein
VAPVEAVQTGETPGLVLLPLAVGRKQRHDRFPITPAEGIEAVQDKLGERTPALGFHTASMRGAPRDRYLATFRVWLATSTPFVSQRTTTGPYWLFARKLSVIAAARLSRPLIGHHGGRPPGAW